MSTIWFHLTIVGDVWAELLLGVVGSHLPAESAMTAPGPLTTAGWAMREKRKHAVGAPACGSEGPVVSGGDSL